MFTGIIEELGIVKSLEKKASSAVLSVQTKKVSPDTALGDSMSVNGTCLTVVQNIAGVLKFDVSAETLKKTNIGNLKPDDRVNLERALKASSRLGGHFVIGHIDCTSKIKGKAKIENTVKIEFEIQPAFSKYIVPKGSIAVDGISLTVGEVFKDSFTVYIIPYTFDNATLGFKKEGDIVNIELDILAKYTDKLLSAKGESSMTKEFLTEHGFI